MTREGGLVPTPRHANSEGDERWLGEDAAAEDALTTTAGGACVFFLAVAVCESGSALAATQSKHPGFRFPFASRHHEAAKGQSHEKAPRTLCEQARGLANQDQGGEGVRNKRRNRMHDERDCQDPSSHWPHLFSIGGTIDRLDCLLGCTQSARLVRSALAEPAGCSLCLPVAVSLPAASPLLSCPSQDASVLDSAMIVALVAGAAVVRVWQLASMPALPVLVTKAADESASS